MSASSSCSVEPNVHERVERAHEAAEQRLVGDQHADRQLAVHDLEAAEHQDRRGRQRLARAAAPSAGDLGEHVRGPARC